MPQLLKAEQETRESKGVLPSTLPPVLRFRLRGDSRCIGKTAILHRQHEDPLDRIWEKVKKHAVFKPGITFKKCASTMTM